MKKKDDGKTDLAAKLALNMPPTTKSKFYTLN